MEKRVILQVGAGEIQGEHLLVPKGEKLLQKQKDALTAGLLVVRSLRTLRARLWVCSDHQGLLPKVLGICSPDF